MLHKARFADLAVEAQGSLSAMIYRGILQVNAAN